jgi:hypothetical protein
LDARVLAQNQTLDAGPEVSMLHLLLPTIINQQQLGLTYQRTGQKRNENKLKEVFVIGCHIIAFVSK